MDTVSEEKITKSYRNVLFKKTKAIEKALEYAYRYGQIDGAHHKQWVIDQMVRALLECPMIEKTAKDSVGESYTYEYQGESLKYKKMIKDYEYLSNEGKHEEEKIYSWDIGIAP